MEKNRHALDTGGDVKIGSDLGLERFQAQPIWEIPDNNSDKLTRCTYFFPRRGSQVAIAPE